jgi:hypothetical protein
MRYTLVWIPDADDELARIWTAAIDKRAVADATNEIERTLKRSPLSVGVEYDDDDRCLVISPLEVIYTVSPGDPMVRILWVARII